MSEREDPRRPSARPVVVAAENGAVLLDGPYGAVVALTPEAAAATSESLRRAAALAASQRGTGSDPVPLRPRD